MILSIAEELLKISYKKVRHHNYKEDSKNSLWLCRNKGCTTLAAVSKNGNVARQCRHHIQQSNKLAWQKKLNIKGE